MNTKNTLLILLISLNATSLSYSMDLMRYDCGLKYGQVEKPYSLYTSSIKEIIETKTTFDFTCDIGYKTALFFPIDNEGNTALHYALNRNNLTIAEQIATIRPELLETENNAGQLPDFSTTDKGRTLFTKLVEDKLKNNQKYSIIRLFSGY